MMTATPLPPSTSTPITPGRTELPGWAVLQRHAAAVREVSLQELFDTGPHRVCDLAFDALGLYADFSKHRVASETMRLRVELAAQCGLPERIAEMFAGEQINVSEHRAALHTALRAPREAVIRVEG